MSELVAHAVSKLYSAQQILHDVSFRIPVSQITVIVGPSGAGKSTLLRILAFLEQPSRGYVSLAVGDEAFDSRRNLKPWPLITCVFQRQFLWPHLTIRQNIEVPIRKMCEPLVQKRVDDIINLFDIHHYMKRYPNQISGGEAQRVALARAFVLQPKLILVDEPHTGLDLLQQSIVNNYFCRIREEDMGLLVISHSIDFARRHADQILVLDQGRLVETGGCEILEAPVSEFLRSCL